MNGKVEFRWLFDWSYRISLFIGVLTYFVYGALNNAWLNPVLIGIAIYMFLGVPFYSKISNGLEGRVRDATTLLTLGRAARYAFQFGFNLILLWVFVAGRILDPVGLDGVGGFVAAAASITAASQGGQYLAVLLGQNRIGTANRNVVIAILVSVVVNALAVSGVVWIQPTFVVASFMLGIALLLTGVFADARSLFERGNYVPDGQRLTVTKGENTHHPTMRFTEETLP